MAKVCAVALACATLLLAPAAASARRRRDAGSLRAGDVAVVRGDDGRQHRAADRPAARRRVARHPDVDDEHRRVHVERRRGREARDHQPRRAAAPHGADRHRRSRGWRRSRGRASSTTGTTTAPGEKMTTDNARRAARPDPLLRRQRLARGRPEDRRRARAAAARAHARDLRRDGLRLLLPARGQPHPLPLRAGHRATRRRAATTRSSPRAGSPTTSASPRATCRRRSSTGSGGRSPTRASTTSRSSVRRASRAATRA